MSLNFYIVTIRRENPLLERVSLGDAVEITTCRHRGTWYPKTFLMHVIFTPLITVLCYVTLNLLRGFLLWSS